MMPAKRITLLAAAAFVAAALMAYAVTYRPPTKIGPTTMVAYTQQVFGATRVVTASGFTLQSLTARTDGNNVEVTWYDSSLAQVAGRSGIYASLVVDDHEVASALSGSYAGVAEKGPDTLRWAGPLPAGIHRFQLTLTHGRKADLPYVVPGLVGVDSLVVTQEPGGG
jgi:hypothetical protein